MDKIKIGDEVYKIFFGQPFKMQVREIDDNCQTPVYTLKSKGFDNICYHTRTEIMTRTEFLIHRLSE